MLKGAALDAALGAVVSRGRRLQFFRATPLVYIDDPLGRGRPIEALRFNAAGGARVLYLGENQHVCMDEVGATGFPTIGWLCVPVEVHLLSVLDLTDRKIRAALGLSLADAQRNFRPINARGHLAETQELGERCNAIGLFDGILFPSAAAKSGTCIAVLEQQLRSSARVLVRIPLRAGVPMKVAFPPGLTRFPPTPAGESPIWDQLP